VPRVVNYRKRKAFLEGGSAERDEGLSRTWGPIRSVAWGHLSPRSGALRSILSEPTAHVTHVGAGQFSRFRTDHVEELVTAMLRPDYLRHCGAEPTYRLSLMDFVRPN